MILEGLIFAEVWGFGVYKPTRCSDSPCNISVVLVQLKLSEFYGWRTPYDDAMTIIAPLRCLYKQTCKDICFFMGITSPNSETGRLSCVVGDFDYG